MKRRPVEGERPVREDLVTQACLEAYGAIRHEGRLADRALDFTLRSKKHLYSNERRAVAERIYALLRRQITVEHLLDRARPGFDKLASTQKDLLRIAASRVLMGESVASVTRGMGLGGADAQGLELLPAAAAELQAMPSRDRYPIAASLPPFLAEKFREEFGAQAETAAEAMNERGPLSARVNTLKGDREKLMQLLRDEGADCRAAPLSPLGVILETRINAFSMAAFQDGYFELHVEGSLLLGMLVDPPPTKVIDACAGAGGKTLQLAAQMKNRGELFAFDINERRMEDLRRRARRADVHNVRVRVIPESGDPAREAVKDLVGKADRVLVDAPCSGTGTYRRKPDARYRLGPEDLAMQVARQRELLGRFSELVKPGGRIIYGTCSVLREENEAVVEDFLAAHPEFSLKPASDELGPELGAKTTRGGYLRLAPHLHGTDGFFGAILLKKK
jgi:16S rRNA (cytosine967-C5)-methyltransferase